MVVEEAAESCGSHAAAAAAASGGAAAAATSSSSAAAAQARKQQQQQRHKLEVYTEVLRRLHDAGVPEAQSPGFDDELWNHFNRLPARYAMDVNVERAEDVLTHKRLLEQARDPAQRPAFAVRVVQVSPVLDGNQTDADSNTAGEEVASRLLNRQQSIHPPPAFGSSTNLEALALEASKSQGQDHDSTSDNVRSLYRPMHEITFSTIDKPKLLSELTSLLGELGLNIQEAHAFSTNDGYSLDVFVVVGWHDEETEDLIEAVQKEIDKIEETQAWSTSHSWSSPVENMQIVDNSAADHVEIPTDGASEWEIDVKLLKFGNKVASGSYGDLFRGTYCSQDVAIKVLKPERINADMQREFAQEVYIMRKVRHRNVVQFIGACTKPPNLCIVTEYMSSGSVYDYLHKHKGVFKLPALLGVAMDVSKGMSYLHQNNIIHRDLKTANLLMDENGIVKVADFGVARVKAQSGVMTAETGTYRWMAPEVIEHKPYDHKADVFSFGILLWELLTGKIPYEYLTPLQAAVGVVQKGLRPTIPKNTHAKLAELLQKCWQQDPAQRPDFSEILETLQRIAEEMDRSWIKSRMFSREHVDGVNEFMTFVSERFNDDEEILCPCRRCLNRVRKPKGQVEDHLYIHGMAATYTRWVHHGEPLEVVPHEIDDHVDEQTSLDEDFGMNVDEEDDPDDGIHGMVEDLYTAEEEGKRKESMFAILLEEMKQELYPGGPCQRFSFVVKLLHIKSFYRISNVAFTAFLKLLSSAFPNWSIPTTYEEAKRLIRALGLGYNSIHVCPNNCVLFRKNLEKVDVCPVCSASRWKDNDGKKKIPEKVLRHFPLIPRLKRIFSSKKRSEEVQWHKLKRVPVENELSHPADGEAWKDFDRKYGWFAEDARNIRLGLATDGFNPFGKMSSSYSMWPVFLIPYNFAPWECVEQSNFIMGLLIPGRECPGKDIDVFLEPLVEELLELWKGVPTLDAITGKKFDLHAAVIWCIHDYPALSTLSGRVTRGYYACVHCDKNPCSKRIRNKICYTGHRRFLARDHPWRRSKVFDGSVENREKPEKFTTGELMEQLERVKDVRPGKHPESRKRKRDAEGQCWKRRSCLWDLPYWSSLKLQHNLDVMHIEKNICEYILATFLGLAGKSKDNPNSRLDLEDMGIRKNLHLIRDGKSYTMPHAPYTMTKKQKSEFCDFLKSVKFPDGYASNLATCVTADGCNLQALKTHDCHILLQRIIPAAVRGMMQKDICEALAELGNFFQQLCAKTLKLDVLERLKAEIPIILCKLEKIFPPSFFDVMLHLAVHLPEEAILRGPVQYGWMYPVERRLLTLKRFVRNMARPEGSIAEAYVAAECLNFCSRYFDDDIETRHNREGRNRERVPVVKGDLSIFQHGVELLGAPSLTYLEHDYEKMVWFVLNNCPEVEPYIEIYKEELENEGCPNVPKTLEKQFSPWFKKHVAKLRYAENQDIDDELFALSSEPDLRVRIYSACLVNGVRFHTVDREKNRRTQNSGVMTEGTHDNQDIDFYGSLKEIIELRYNADEGGHRTVVLFRCDWFDTHGKKFRMKEDGFFRSINHGRLWYRDDPFILAAQATKIFYLLDTKYRENWRVVQNFSHRHLWSVAENDNGNIPDGVVLSYQDDDCEGVHVRVDASVFENEQPVCEDGVRVDASVVDDLRVQREAEGEQDESSDSEDETGWQYVSDNEGPTIPPEDDDDSDYE